MCDTGTGGSLRTAPPSRFAPPAPDSSGDTLRMRQQRVEYLFYRAQLVFRLVASQPLECLSRQAEPRLPRVVGIDQTSPKTGRHAELRLPIPGNLLRLIKSRAWIIKDSAAEQDGHRNILAVHRVQVLRNRER